MRAAATGETYQERTKGKDVRTSNIVAAKVGPLVSDSVLEPMLTDATHVLTPFRVYRLLQMQSGLH